MRNKKKNTGQQLFRREMINFDPWAWLQLGLLDSSVLCTGNRVSNNNQTKKPGEKRPMKLYAIVVFAQALKQLLIYWHYEWCSEILSNLYKLSSDCNLNEFSHITRLVV